jgi:hypothetical protein
LSKVLAFHKSVCYLALLIARGTTSRFSKAVYFTCPVCFALHITIFCQYVAETKLNLIFLSSVTTANSFIHIDEVKMEILKIETFAFFGSFRGISFIKMCNLSEQNSQLNIYKDDLCSRHTKNV